MKLENVMHLFRLFEQLKRSEDIPESTRRRFIYNVDKNIDSLRSALKSDAGAIKLLGMIDFFTAEQQRIMNENVKRREAQGEFKEDSIFTTEQIADMAKIDESKNGKDLEAELKGWIDKHPEYVGINKKFAEYDLKLKGYWHRVKPEWMPKVDDHVFSALIQDGIVLDENSDTAPMEIVDKDGKIKEGVSLYDKRLPIGDYRVYPENTDTNAPDGKVIVEES